MNVRISRSAFCSGVLSTALAASVSKAAASVAVPTCSPGDMLADLQWLKTTLLEVAVQPFAFSSQAIFGQAFADAEVYCAQPRSILDFGLRAMRVFASLHDGHCGVRMFSVISRLRERGLRGFPLDYLIRERRMFVGAQSDARFQTGTEILSINGIPVGELIDRSLPYVSAQNESLALAFLPTTLLQYLYVAFPAARSYDVALKTAQGTTAVTLAATTFAERSAEEARFRNASNAAIKGVSGDLVPYSFSRIADGRVAYIDYRACQDEHRFRSFLEATFTSIRETPVRGVIVDIRKNGGGDDTLNDDLWGYLTDKPYTQYGAMVIKVSDYLKRLYGRDKYEDIYSKQAWSMPDGSLLRIPLEPQAPPANPLRYDGPVVVLIGPGTFSSAMECALAAKDFGLATLVGQETGEPVDASGELTTGTSPRLGLDFYFPTKFFYGYRKRPPGQGVLPDVTIPEPPAGSPVTSDPALEWSVAHILDGSIAR